MSKHMDGAWTRAWDGMERRTVRWVGQDGTGRYCWVSAAEPIKTSTAHYFACFSFDNNAESDPNQPKKKNEKNTDSKAEAESWC